MLGTSCQHPLNPRASLGSDSPWGARGWLSWYLEIPATKPARMSEWDRWSWGDVKLCLNDQTALSVTVLSRLFLAEQGPALAPGEGEGGIFLYFRVVQGEQKGQKGAERWKLGSFGAEGKGCVVTTASWLLCKINMIIWGRPLKSFNC